MSKKDELPQAKVDRMAREENESDKKAMKKILGAAAAVPAGLAGLAMSAHPDFPGPIDSARLSGKLRQCHRGNHQIEKTTNLMVDHQEYSHKYLK